MPTGDTLGMGEDPILVVEDNELVRSLIAMTLADAGYPVVTAANGASALERVRHLRVRLIVLDLLLPITSGREFLAQYRQLPGPHAPVLVCSAKHDAARQAAAAGAHGFLAKPFTGEDVLNAVVRLT